jgi:7-cyano-7-deazaguanine synthase
MESGEQNLMVETIEVEKPKVLLLFSGGFDSTVLLWDLISQGNQVHLLFIKWGQKPLLREFECFQYWASKYELDYTILEIPALQWSNSTMFNHSHGKISIDDDYVEMRNLIFYSYASSLAESLGIVTIASAILWNSFKDTTPYFAKSFDSMLFNTSEMDLYTPYMYMKDKALLGDFAEKELGVVVLKEIMEHSFSCNVPIDSKECGTCYECNKRKDIKNKFFA